MRIVRVCVCVCEWAGEWVGVFCWEKCAARCCCKKGRAAPPSTMTAQISSARLLLAARVV